MRLGISWTVLGMAAGLIASICCIWAEIVRSGPVTGAILMACLGVGIPAVLAWANDLQQRCTRYEKLLRKHGIDRLETVL